MASFFAHYWTTQEGKLLLGGVKEGKSSRFDCQEDARDYLDNLLALQPIAQGVVLASGKHPEIFRHCPDSAPQAIGGKCFTCKKILTVADAKRAGVNRKPQGS